MKIGITYDLRAEYLAAGFGEEETAEFDRLETIDAIDAALRNAGAATERIGGLKSLVAALAAGRRWDLVFNIAEGMRGFGREAAIPALLEEYGIPFVFSDALVCALTLHKGMAKRVVRDAGLPTPPFAVVESEAGLAAVDLPYPLFVKPVSEGTGKGVTEASKVLDQGSLFTQGRLLLERYRQPVLVETFLPGREFTVGVLGTGAAARIMGVMEIILLAHSDPEVYSYRNKEICEEVVEYRLVDDDKARQAAVTALDAYRILGCRDAGRVDLREDAEGRACFIEINPLAGLHPKHSDLCILAAKRGMSYQNLMQAILSSATAR